MPIPESNNPFVLSAADERRPARMIAKVSAHVSAVSGSIPLTQVSKNRFRLPIGGLTHEHFPKSKNPNQ
jgi:hypothetical protein